MTRHLLTLLVVLAIIAGCSRMSPEPGDGGVAAAQPQRSETNRFLAYEHTLGIEADDDKVVPLFEAAQTACREAAEDACAILSARVSSGEGAQASMKFRARPEGIRKLIAVLSAQGRIVSQATTAEDLAGPITDAAKQIAMLSDYRKQLEGLRSRPSNDLDALMRLSRELASVQSQIESLAGEQAHLVQRVETEILNVAIGSPYRGEAAWSPIAEAGKDFGGILSSGIAGVMLAVAYLLPWVVVIGLVALGVRAFLARRKRRKAQTGG